MNEANKELVIQTPNVDFQIEPKKRNQGIFSLFSDENEYIIEWIPDPKRDKATLKNRNIPPKVTVSFHQIDKIERVNYSLSKVALSFSLDDGSRLPIFIFNIFPHIFVTHFLEFLIFKNIIRVNAHHQTIYHVLKKQTPSANVVNEIPRSIFQNDEKTDLTPEEVVSIHTHNQILTQIGYKPLQNSSTQQPHMSVTVSDMVCIDFSQIKKLIFLQGIAPESRPFIWPILFGVLPYSSDVNLINSHLKKITNEYLNIQTQYEQFTEDQIENSPLIQDIQRIIANDVHRNDRNEDAFKGNDNPNLSLLKNVLIAYAIFNRDTSYVQGMNDLVSPFIVIFIKEWEKDGNAVFFDGTIKTREEAEAFIFWSFVGMMELTQHERLFTDLASHQAFVLGRVAAIATAVHPPLKKLLKKSDELNNLSFLFKPMLLLFKRAFKTNDLWRLWDSIFTADSPYCYSRFVGAAILILLFPKLLIHTNQTLGEVMSFADGFMSEVDIESVLLLANLLVKKLGRSHPLHDFVYESMPDRNDYRRFFPKYFKLK